MANKSHCPVSDMEGLDMIVISDTWIDGLDIKDRSISMFGDRRFEHTYSSRPSTPVQIVRQYVSNNGQYKTSYSPYQRYKGLSSMPNLAGDKQTYLDTKQPIYKHYIRYMPDMGILGYGDLANLNKNCLGFFCVENGHPVRVLSKHRNKNSKRRNI